MINLMRMNDMLQALSTQAKKYKEGIEKMVVPTDPTPTDMKSLVAAMDDLYTNVRVGFATLKSIRSAVESLIDSTEKGSAVGNNASERQAAAVLSVTNFEYMEGDKKVTIDLYRKYEDIMYVFNQYEAFVDIINRKHDRLILDSAVMKVESNLQQ